MAKGIDGVFVSGPLANKTVNIKFYAKRESSLDIPKTLPDYFLVLTRPKPNAMTSRGEPRLWNIDWAFLFSAAELVQHLSQRQVKIGVATSVIKEQWDRGEIFPVDTNRDLVLDSSDREMIQLFGSERQNDA